MFDPNFDSAGDKFKEECGLIGVWNHREAANIAYLGLYAQQHRGQEGAGVVSLDLPARAIAVDGSHRPPESYERGTLCAHRGLGLVNDVFGGFDFTTLPGSHSIGHVRYTTAGGNILANVQPFTAEVSCGKVAIAHNGNLINTDQLRGELIREGAILNSTSDTELILHLLARSPRKAQQRGAAVIEAVIASLQRVRGAYSLLLLFEDRLLAVRDAQGLRPLSLGILDGGVVVASETCAFDLVGAKFLRDVAPGEIVDISGENEIRSYFPFGVQKEASCVFEYVYFARPDSNIYGRNVYRVRRAMGEELAREHPAQADLVVPVPDSGMTAALGYAHESKIPLELGLIRNHYVGRTFIEPKQIIRDFGVKVKLNPNPELLRGKSVVVVDDSIVRGTTSKKLIDLIRQAGAREVHLRISSPPTTDPCYYGIDTPQKGELIASRMSIEEIRAYLGVESIAYLSVAGMYRAVAAAEPKDGENIGRKFCDACFTGVYPVGTPLNYSKRQADLL